MRVKILDLAQSGQSRSAQSAHNGAGGEVKRGIEYTMKRVEAGGRVITTESRFGAQGFHQPDICPSLVGVLYLVRSPLESSIDFLPGLASPVQPL